MLGENYQRSKNGQVLSRVHTPSTEKNQQIFQDHMLDVFSKTHTAV